MKQSWNFKDLTGQRFGRLVVKRYSHTNKHRKACWVCECDCGREVVVSGKCLRYGDTQSCGCLHTEQRRKMAKKIFSTHNLKFNSGKLYSIWGDIKTRCYNPKHIGYKNYGGRGITMCDEWRNDFKSFYDWAMANGYKEEKLPSGHNKWTIDRVNNDGNYEPNNCRWATMFVQNHNKRKKLSE